MTTTPSNGRARLSRRGIITAALALTVLPFIVTFPPFNGFGVQRDWVGGFADAGVFEG